MPIKTPSYFRKQGIEVFQVIHEYGYGFFIEEMKKANYKEALDIWNNVLRRGCPKPKVFELFLSKIESFDLLYKFWKKYYADWSTSQEISSCILVRGLELFEDKFGNLKKITNLIRYSNGTPTLFIREPESFILDNGFCVIRTKEDLQDFCNKIPDLHLYDSRYNAYFRAKMHYLGKRYLSIIQRPTLRKIKAFMEIIPDENKTREHLCNLQDDLLEPKVQRLMRCRFFQDERISCFIQNYWRDSRHIKTLTNFLDNKYQEEAEELIRTQSDSRRVTCLYLTLPCGSRYKEDLYNLHSKQVRRKHATQHQKMLEMVNE
jgi:hypothetical protein